MELTNEFVIDRGVEDTWKILNDLEFIAPCMPGAQLQEIEGDEYRGVVKVKVGPITAQYKGKASFVEQDEANKVARLKAEGRDPRQGNANAMITATMEAVEDGKTTVTIHTDLGLAGKLASFGRGAIEDVSKKILGQFTENLRQRLEQDSQANNDDQDASEPSEAHQDSATEPEPQTAEAPESDAADESANQANSTPEIRKIESGEADPVDLLSVTGGAVAKRAVPVGVVGAIVLAIIYWIFRG